MRLCLATPLYPPEPGGPATYAKALVEGLPAKGVEVRLVPFSGVRAFPKGVRHLMYAWKVFKEALSCDVVYVLDPVSTGVPAYIGALCAGKPLYLRTAGDYAWEQGTQRYGITDTLNEFVKRTSYPSMVHVFRSIQRFIAKRAVRIVVPSAYLKGILETWGVDAEKIRVVYNAAPSFPSRETLSLPEGVQKPYLVTVCRLVPWKGVEGILEVLVALPDLSLVVVGEGPEEESLREKARALGIDERVLFTGALTHGTAPAYVAHAEALVLNTRYEGFSHVILEAFALGVPVITTPVGGNPEQVTDGESGLLVPYGNVDAMVGAVKRIQEESGLRARLIAGGTQSLSRFTPEGVIQGTRKALSLI